MSDTTKRLSVEDITVRTILAYGTDPARLLSVRAEHEGCAYHGIGGNRCAFSRCCLPEVRLYKYEGNDVSKIRHDLGGLDSLLYEEYRGRTLGFWLDLQALHDNRDNWCLDDGGLTPRGLAFACLLVGKHTEYGETSHRPNIPGPEPDRILAADRCCKRAFQLSMESDPNAV